MPPFIPVTNAAQFELQFSQSDGSFAENQFWIQRTGAWSLAQLNTMAAALKTWYTTGDGANSYNNNQSNTCALQGIAFRDMTTQNSSTGIYQTGLPIAAINAGTAAPLGLSFAITARTGLAGRNFRGRSFFIGMQATDFSDLTKNLVASAAAAHFVSIWNSLITAVPAADVAASLVVCSRYHQPGGPGTPTVPRLTGVTTPITSYGFHDLFADFQRRRAPGHNRHR